MMFPVSLIIIITQDEITCYMASFWRAHSHFLCSAVISLLSHLYPRPWKEHFYSPRLIMIRTKWAAGEGVSVDKKKKYLWFKCRHISPKRLTSLFSQWILNVFDEFNALWSRQNTVWAILTIWISYVRVKNRMNLIWKEKWHSVFARDKKQNNPPHNITLCFLPSAGCFVYIHAVYLHTAPPHPNRFTHPHTHLQTQRGVDVWLMLSIFTFLAN